MDRHDASVPLQPPMLPSRQASTSATPSSASPLNLTSTTSTRTTDEQSAAAQAKTTSHASSSRSQSAEVGSRSTTTTSSSKRADSTGGEASAGSAEPVGVTRQPDNQLTSSTTEPVFLDRTAQGRKLQQKTDKSCVQCRLRRVRCDRGWPSCTRCRKRREECGYGEGVTIEVSEDTTEDPKVVALQARLDTAERKLARVQAAEASTAATHPKVEQPDNPAAATAGVSEDLVQSIYGAFEPLKLHERDTVAQKLATLSTMSSAIGPSGVDWKLVKPRLAEALTHHLLDTSTCCCCSRLTSFTPLIARVSTLKRKLTKLNHVEQAMVAVLCALGARSSPHSAILGIEVPGLSSGTADPELFLTVGTRREKACRSLLNRATDITWYGGMLSEAPCQESVEVLTGIAQLLIFDEIRPKKSRFFLRNAIGMYQDLQLEMPDDQLLRLKQSCGAALFREDSVHSAQLCLSPLISAHQLADYFTNPDITLPDFANERLQGELDRILNSPHDQVTLSMLRKAVSIVTNWVAYLQRTFAHFGPKRRTQSSAVLSQARQLWTRIDLVQQACQRLETFIMSFTGQSLAGDSDDDHDPEEISHLVLLAVRTDTRLIDLTNLIDNWLASNDFLKDDVLNDQDKTMLNDMKIESDCRVRKGLRMTAVFSRLYLSSDDKHVCHHLVQQAELLSNWTQLALQSLDDMNGPRSSEYEVSTDELDWLISALRLSLFYTPNAYKRLKELDVGRKRRAELAQASTDLAPARPALRGGQAAPPSSQSSLTRSSELLDAFVKHQNQAMNPGPQQMSLQTGSTNPFAPKPQQQLQRPANLQSQAQPYNMSASSSYATLSPLSSYSGEYAPPATNVNAHPQTFYDSRATYLDLPQQPQSMYSHARQHHQQHQHTVQHEQQQYTPYTFEPEQQQFVHQQQDNATRSNVHPVANQFPPQMFPAYTPHFHQSQPPRMSPLSIPFPQPFSFDRFGSPQESPGYRSNHDAAASARFDYVDDTDAQARRNQENYQYEPNDERMDAE
ncbi:hypothetical protein OIO90_003303 [Microbotryomycetes sp. JL221]|nr:hypothetical protein OIO90_003303 [Microbotryomycetes sp. JL221]